MRIMPHASKRDTATFLCDITATFLSVTDTYAHHENRSLIQRLAPARSARQLLIISWDLMLLLLLRALVIVKMIKYDIFF